MAKSVQKLSRQNVVDIHAMLTGIITKLDDNFCRYADDWSDEKVASHFGVSVAGVSGVRRELFGKLAPVPGGRVGSAAEMNAKLVELENAVSNAAKDFMVMVTAFSELTVRYNRLCDNLTANRVVSVKHLRYDATAPAALAETKSEK